MPSTACASSRSPSASTRGSVLRTRPLPKSDVSPRSPARVVTRADARRRAGIVRRIRAFALAEVGEGGRPSAMLDVPRALQRGAREGTMPTGRGEAKDKKAKKKSKEQLEKELRKKSVAQPVQPMTFEIVKPKRKEKESW